MFSSLPITPRTIPAAATPAHHNGMTWKRPRRRISRKNPRKKKGRTNTVKSVFHEWKRSDVPKQLIHLSSCRGEQPHSNIDSDLAHREQET